MPWPLLLSSRPFFCVRKQGESWALSLRPGASGQKVSHRGDFPEQKLEGLESLPPGLWGTFASEPERGQGFVES